MPTKFGSEPPSPSASVIAASFPVTWAARSTEPAGLTSPEELIAAAHAKPGTISLAALGPADEMGVLLWDGTERWVFELQKVGEKKKLAAQIAGMNQGDLGSFQGVMSMAHEALALSTANLKHIIVFSDGDQPSQHIHLEFADGKQLSSGEIGIAWDRTLDPAGICMTV